MFPNLDVSQLYLCLNLDPDQATYTCTFTVGAVSLEPFRAVTLVGAWSVGAVGVGVTSVIVLALVDI